jgi:hypothetical protein
VAAKNAKDREGLSARGVLGRFLAALLLVYATWNPEGWSYFHWITHRPAPGSASWLETPALKLVVGVLLAIGWVIFLTAARRSLGAIGIVLTAALCGGLVWLLVSWEVVSASSVRGLSHIALLVISIILAVGLSWSHLSRRITGQVDADVVD